MRRGQRQLAEGLSFVAPAGAFVELRGGNGAGKTTLLRTIAGFGRPAEGTIVYENIAEPALSIHYVGHLNALKGSETVAAHVGYWAGLFSSPADMVEVLGRVGLERQRDLPARVLSQGQARRLALSRLLLAPRPIWVLDEPSAGLDAQGRAMIAKLIEAHTNNNGIALAAVHEPLGPSPSITLTVGG
ncbi:MAG: heme ABC exporter ATP-binding protein CcmA [Hyphomonadaceae bacterium]|nr:heme ABC exporter ATP-binding protein CcmA [Hyphomonadaceae bacterium]